MEGGAVYAEPREVERGGSEPDIGAVRDSSSDCFQSAYSGFLHFDAPSLRGPGLVCDGIISS